MSEAPTPLTAYQQTYHWRNKNCAPWSYDWFKAELKGLKIDDGKQSAEVEEVTSVTGDCDLGQRKGKLLTIYDFEVELRWIGTGSDGEQVKGTVKIPEVSHEAIDGLSDYTYEIRLISSENTSSSSLLSFVRKSLPPVLEEKFNAFRPALLAAHASSASELNSRATSGASTPNPTASTSYSPAPPTKSADTERTGTSTSSAPSAAKKTITTASVEVKATLQVSAEDLWSLLTDASRIPMWSRAQAKMDLKPEANFELFGGNVVGKIISVDRPNKLVQTWQTKSPGWPSAHFGTLTTSLKQGSDSTDLILTLDGVPSGQEAEIERALEAFYIRGLKSMGLVLSSCTRSFRRAIPTTSTKLPAKAGRKAKDKQGAWPASLTPMAVGSVALIALGAVFVGLVVTSLQQTGSS